MIVRQNIDILIEGKSYLINFDSNLGEYYGIETEPFILPNKIYGNYDEDIDMYLHTFSQINKNIGILLSGHKGAGKTVMAKQIMLKSNLPVLIVDQPHHGTAFNNFINGIKQEIVILFDEFEKTYSDVKHQEELLVLFDGAISSKKIFLLTANNVDNMNEFFENRPSRIRYHKKFTSIDRGTLSIIMDDLLENDLYRPDIIEIVDTLGEAGKDLVISIIEESNIFKMSPKEVIKRMNIKLPKSVYDFVAILVDQVEKVSGVYYGHPLAKESLTFSRWMDGFEYDEYIQSMSVQKFEDEIHLSDKKGNKFKFYKKNGFNGLEILDN